MPAATASNAGGGYWSAEGGMPAGMLPLGRAGSGAGSGAAGVWSSARLPALSRLRATLAAGRAAAAAGATTATTSTASGVADRFLDASPICRVSGEGARGGGARGGGEALAPMGECEGGLRPRVDPPIDDIDGWLPMPLGGMTTGWVVTLSASATACTCMEIVRRLLESRSTLWLSTLMLRSLWVTCLVSRSRHLVRCVRVGVGVRG